MRWSTAAIGELVASVETWSPKSDRPNDYLNYIDIGAVDRETKSIETTQRVLGSEAPSRARQIVQSSDILVSTVRPNLNAVAYVPPEHDGDTASTGFCVLRPKQQRLHSRYLYHWVRSPEFVASMTNRASGQSYPAVSDKIVKGSCIPLPPLEEQKRIAAILDQADTLRRLRQRAIDRLDTLAQSIFFEMFGDLLQEVDHEAQRLPLGEIAEVGSGITKGRKAPKGPLTMAPYLAVSNVQDGHLDLTTVKQIEVSEDELERYKLVRGDLVLTEGGDPDKLGRGTIWNDEIPGCIHQNHIFKVRVQSERIRPQFLSWLISSRYGRRYFLKSAKQTTGIASINKTQLSGFPVPHPELSRQITFGDRLAAIDSQMSLLQKSLLQSEQMFRSLQQRAFRGEL